MVQLVQKLLNRKKEEGKNLPRNKIKWNGADSIMPDNLEIIFLHRCLENSNSTPVKLSPVKVAQRCRKRAGFGARGTCSPSAGCGARGKFPALWVEDFITDLRALF